MHRSFIAIPSRRNPVSAFNRMETIKIGWGLLAGNHRFTFKLLFMSQRTKTTANLDSTTEMVVVIKYCVLSEVEP